MPGWSRDRGQLLATVGRVVSSTDTGRAISLLKAHYPLNRIVGGGFFSGFERLRISEAWELFGEANGTASLDELRRRVGRYRRQSIAPKEDNGLLLKSDVHILFDRGYLGVDPKYRLHPVRTRDLGQFPLGQNGNCPRSRTN
ncbi:HNH endonuclease signature motif containing protein [Micromonospora sp. NPDC051296]|uniref:HNH endonuclease signature motif containing protein n=1 Tax=Micromonospora sp. NPDC051296 TaxID=3155046 RepID=UPI0034150D8F